MLELLRALDLPSTGLLNACLYEYYPEVVAAFRARGDEIADHGRTNSERQSALSEADAKALIEETIASTAGATVR